MSAISVNLANTKISVPGSVHQRSLALEEGVREVYVGPTGAYVENAYVDGTLGSLTYGNLFIDISDGRTINAGYVGAEIQGVSLQQVYDLLQSALDGDPNNDNFDVPDFRIWYDAGKL